MKILQVKVKPNSPISRLEKDADSGGWIAHTRSPPVDGKANPELIDLVTRQFGCPKSAVSIKTGASSRVKRLQISGDE